MRCTDGGVALRERIGAAVGRRVASMRSIGGGAAGTVWRVSFDDGSTLVAKEAAAGLVEEARGLRLLGERGGLPVPRVMHAEATLMVMEDVRGRASFSAPAERDAAGVLARLHMTESPDARYGLDFDNYIGPLPQPNSPCETWPEFFGARRLAAFAEAAAREGAIGASVRRGVERLCLRLGEFVPERPRASLIHGDVWGGNVIAEGDRIAAFLDPSPYYAHAEVELAFIRLFSTFGGAFEEKYRERVGMSASEWREFERVRCGLYNLYPLLMHARLFGGHYAAEVERTLRRLGFGV